MRMTSLGKDLREQKGLVVQTFEHFGPCNSYFWRPVGNLTYCFYSLVSLLGSRVLTQKTDLLLRAVKGLNLRGGNSDRPTDKPQR